MSSIKWIRLKLKEELDEKDFQPHYKLFVNPLSLALRSLHVTTLLKSLRPITLQWPNWQEKNCVLHTYNYCTTLSRIYIDHLYRSTLVGKDGEFVVVLSVLFLAIGYWSAYVYMLASRVGEFGIYLGEFSCVFSVRYIQAFVLGSIKWILLKL